MSAKDAKQGCAGLLGLCRRAGRLTVGFDAVCALLRDGKAVKVLLASDISPKTEKELRFLQERLPAPVAMTALPLSKEEIGQALGSHKPVGVAATDDNGFAASFQKYCDNGEEFAI